MKKKVEKKWKKSREQTSFEIFHLQKKKTYNICVFVCIHLKLHYLSKLLRSQEEKKNNNIRNELVLSWFILRSSPSRYSNKLDKVESNNNNKKCVYPLSFILIFLLLTTQLNENKISFVFNFFSSSSLLNEDEN